MSRASLLGRLAGDLCAWLLLVALFLAFYVEAFGLPGAAVLPHICIVATLWLALAVVRILSAFLPWRRASLWVSAFALAAAATTVILYYALVLVGLKSWNRVITWDLIRTYARQ